MKILKTRKYTILKSILQYSFVFIFAFTLFFSSVSVNTVNGDFTINTKIENPLGEKGPSNLPAFIEKAIEIILIIGVPLVVLAIIYSGFLFVSAQGNSEKLKTAKKTLLTTIIGAALLLGAYVIANAISTTVDEIKQGAS